MPDLRRAVAWALAQGSTATTDEVAAIGETDAHTALRYLRALSRAADPVAVEQDGNWSAGRGFKAWAAQRTTTKVGNGGNSRGYRRAKAARDAIRARAWQQTKTGVLTCERVPDPTPSSTMMDNAATSSHRGACWYTYHQAADMLNLTDKALRRMAATGKLAVKRWGPRTVRIHADEVARIEKQGAACPA